jgi:hypothetical protein
MLAKGVDGPIGLIGCRINERPCLLDEFNQATLEAQPLALERISRLALCADLADQLEKRAGVSHALIYSSQDARKPRARWVNQNAACDPVRLHCRRHLDLGCDDPVTAACALYRAPVSAVVDGSASLRVL